MATAKTETRPARARKAAPKKADPATPAAAPVEAATPKPEEAKRTPVADPSRSIVLDLVPDGDTKNFAKFTYPEGCGCVGTIYAPLGTEQARLLLVAGAPAAG